MAALLSSCASLELDDQGAPRVVAIFDPDESDIPMPNDALRDDELERLDLPVDEDEGLSPAELAFRQYLNRLEGWSSTMQATVSFSGAVDPATVDVDTVQVWEWGPTPRRVMDVEVELEKDDTELVITPPREGWLGGHTYTVLVRGYDEGVQDTLGRGIGQDVAFFYLRISERLDVYENNRAFPGDTRAERLDNAAKLEEIREDLDPMFRFFEEELTPAAAQIPREEMATLWSFTITESPELAMDRESQRIPVPFDLLIDRETGLIDLDPAPWDDEVEADAKLQLNELNGFGVSSGLFFETTLALDPTTVSTDTIELWEVGASGDRQLAIEVSVFAEDGVTPCMVSPAADDCLHVSVEPDASELPLELGARYVVVAREGLRGKGGRPVVAMPIGHLMVNPHELTNDGQSEIGSIDDEDAQRLEWTRRRVSEFLDRQGRGGLISAWPFTTMTPEELPSAARRAEELGEPIAPTVLSRMNGDEALSQLFPGLAAGVVRAVYIPRVLGVAEFVEGTIPSPYYLDRVTRRFRPDDEHDTEDVRFLAAMPRGLEPGDEVPVVIFGHAVVTDRRFLVTIAGELARRGFASVAIDFPFHGERIACIEASLVSVPNFFPQVFQDLTGLNDQLLSFPPCASGSSATCSPTGECLDAAGNPDEFTTFPIITLEPASGAAFLDLDDLPFIKDHFLQALIDLSSLHHSLKTADWSEVFGARVDTSRFFYAGQSLGALIGTVWVSQVDDIERAVFNVPGSDMVDLFRNSTFFSPQIDALFERLEVVPGSWEQQRLLTISRWLIDSVDPHIVARRYRDDDRDVLLQMDRGDIVIPNFTTEALARVSERPMRTYASPLHADLIVPLIGDAMLSDMGAFLSGEISE